MAPPGAPPTTQVCKRAQRPMSIYNTGLPCLLWVRDQGKWGAEGQEALGCFEILRSCLQLCRCVSVGGASWSAPRGKEGPSKVSCNFQAQGCGEEGRFQVQGSLAQAVVLGLGSAVPWGLPGTSLWIPGGLFKLQASWPLAGEAGFTATSSPLPSAGWNSQTLTVS